MKVTMLEMINYMLFIMEIILFIFCVCVGIFGFIYILQEIKKILKR